MSQVFEKIVVEAEAAGMAAGTGHSPQAMVVGEAAGLFGTAFKPGAELHYVAEGVCGFAWVHFAGSTAFGRWMKKTGRARADYPKGLCVWVRQFGQSMERKEAYAQAYAKVLASHGIECYAQSRMD